MTTATLRIASEDIGIETLNKEQQARLKTCEKVIRKGQESFTQMAKAVVTIRDEKLYLLEFTTLGAYFSEKWDMSPQDVTRYTNAGKVLNLLEQKGHTVLPMNEAQARALADLTPDMQVAVWDAAVKSGEKITAKLIHSLATKDEHDKWESFTAAAEAEAEATEQSPETYPRKSTLSVTVFSDDDCTAIKNCLSSWELSTGTVHGKKDASHLSASVAPDQIPTMLKQLAEKLSASMPSRLSLSIEL